MTRTRHRFFDPEGTRYGIPTWPWRMAPGHLATRRQLSAAGLRPAGAPVVGQVMWMRRRTVAVAYLYETAAAEPKREFTPGLARSVAAMLAARSTCSTCGAVFDYCLPAGRECLNCRMDHVSADVADLARQAEALTAGAARIGGAA